MAESEVGPDQHQFAREGVLRGQIPMEPRAAAGTPPTTGSDALSRAMCETAPWGSAPVTTLGWAPSGLTLITSRRPHVPMCGFYFLSPLHLTEIHLTRKYP